MNAIPTDLPGRQGAIDMTHGGGGRAMAELIRDLFHRHLGNAHLAQGNDERQREGWEVIAEHARTERVKVITAIVDEGPGLLPQDLHEYFERSIEPSQHFR